MPQSTLLDIVQEILSSMDSDTVNSYSDTIESEQVAFIVRRSYFDLINQLKIPEHRDVLLLTAMSDTDRPTHMKLPSGVSQIISVRYNTIDSGETRLEYTEIKYLQPEDFTNLVLTRDSTDSTIQTVDITGGKLLIRNDRQPEYYTSYDDEYMIFDSFDGAIDDTLQQSKFMVYGTKEPVWTFSDTFIPDLDSSLFPLLLNEAKSLAFVELKQTANPKAEQAATRQRSTWQNDKSNIDNVYRGPDYGRKTRGRI